MKAIEYHRQRLAIAKEVGDRAGEVGDRAGEGRAYGNLGTCHMHLNEFVKAVAYGVKRDLVQCQKRPSTVSKETYYSVTSPTAKHNMPGQHR